MTSVMLPEKTIERLKKEADRYGISMAEMMRRIFDTYFELENNEDKND
jgi:predicted DNA-binding protein